MKKHKIEIFLSCLFIIFIVFFSVKQHYAKIRLINFCCQNIIPDKSGLTGWYHLNDYKEHRQKIDEKIHFHSQNSKLFALEKNFAVIWRGLLNIEKSRFYRIGTTSDDDSSLYIDGVPVLNNLGPHHPVKKERQIFLSKGHHTIKATYRQREGEAYMELLLPSPEINLLPLNFSLKEEDLNPFIKRILMNKFFVYLLIYLFAALGAYILLKQFIVSSSPGIKNFGARGYSLVKKHIFKFIIISSFLNLFTSQMYLFRNYAFIYWLFFLNLILVTLILFTLIHYKISLPFFKINLIALAMALSFLIIFVLFFRKSPFDLGLLLYFRQGKNALIGQFPDADYPICAIYFFSFIYKISSFIYRDNSTCFILLLNLFKLPFLSGCLFILHLLTKKEGGYFYSTLFTLTIILAPFSIYWWTVNFDIIPLFFLLLGIYLFAREKFVLSFGIISISFLLKWLALLVLPFFTIYLMARRKIGLLFKSIAVALLIIILPLIIFGPEKYLAAFKFQNERTLTAESIYGLFYAPLTYDEFVMLPYSRPWNEIPSPIILSKKFLFNFLLLAMSLLFLLFIREVYKKRDENIHKTTLLYSAFAIILFIALNRIYSPQFLWWWGVCLFLGLYWSINKSSLFEKRILKTFEFLFILSTVFNILVYKFTACWYTIRFCFWAIYALMAIFIIAVAARPATPGFHK